MPTFCFLFISAERPPFNTAQQSPYQTPTRMSTSDRIVGSSFNISPFPQHQTAQYVTGQTTSVPAQTFASSTHFGTQHANALTSPLSSNVQTPQAVSNIPLSSPSAS